MRRSTMNTARGRMVVPFMNREIAAILEDVDNETNDHALPQSIYFGPTALTHIRRVIEMGGTIICDTSLLAGEIDASLLGQNGAKVCCFIDVPQVCALAEQRKSTRAEIAVDYGLALDGPKLFVVGSAPAAINRIIARRQQEPLSDVGVLVAAGGFSSVIQMKERLMEMSIASVVVRGKKGSLSVAAALMNAILRRISGSNEVDQ